MLSLIHIYFTPLQIYFKYCKQRTGLKFLNKFKRFLLKIPSPKLNLLYMSLSSVLNHISNKFSSNTSSSIIILNIYIFNLNISKVIIKSIPTKSLKLYLNKANNLILYCINKTRLRSISTKILNKIRMCNSCLLYTSLHSYV